MKVVWIIEYLHSRTRRWNRLTSSESKTNTDRVLQILRCEGGLPIRVRMVKRK